LFAITPSAGRTPVNVEHRLLGYRDWFLFRNQSVTRRLPGYKGEVSLSIRRERRKVFEPFG
jgi:hypothetical protein